ncbi:MAG TPA: caspase family protein [Chitinophagaceae bacterium]
MKSKLKQLLVFFCLQALAINGFTRGVVPRDESEGFSGKVFLISIGVNDYSRSGNLSNLMSAESDAERFRERLKKDSSVKQVVAYNFSSRHTKSDIIAAFEAISGSAAAKDAFVFFCAVQSLDGKIYLSDNSTIAATELFQLSQNIYASRQLFYLDACHGDQFTGILKRKLMSHPEESAIGDLNRIVLAIRGMAMENREGGFFTLSYARNPDIRLMDVFSKRNSRQIRLLHQLYTSLETMTDKMTIDFFSERDYYSTVTATETEVRSTIKPTGVTKEETKQAKKKIRKGETLSLIIGCSSFDHFTGLGNTLNDAIAIRNTLETKYRHKTILLQDPTYSGFRSELASIKKEYEFEEGSQFLLFAATHGAKDENGTGMMIFKDSKWEDGFLEKAYSLVSIKKAVSQLDCTNSLMLIDICHSGTMFDEGGCVKPAAIEIPVNSPVFASNDNGSPAFKNFLNQKTNLFIGSASDQEAADGTGDHSPFATVVIRFLESNRLPVIDSYHLQQTIQRQVMNEGAISIPMFCAYACRDDGRFLFIQK